MSLARLWHDLPAANNSELSCLSPEGVEPDALWWTPVGHIEAPNQFKEQVEAIAYQPKLTFQASTAPRPTHSENPTAKMQAALKTLQSEHPDAPIELMRRKLLSGSYGLAFTGPARRIISGRGFVG
ncbi:hypothetical protein, partial [Sphingobium phenoxybenzoativorans]|uniref:hypothetical protein n=1 Tax=Sphingobium phenoxybenzoativorans TaxID=1592790 RepID=UPI001C0CD4B7